MLDRRVGWFLVCLAAITALFAKPLARLLQHAAANELHSHIPLVPLIAGFMLYARRPPRETGERASIVGTVAFLAFGLLLLACQAWWATRLSANDELALTTLSYVGLITAAGFIFMGSAWMSAAAFPASFLVFMVPMPDAMSLALENALMLASADAAEWLLRVTGTPLVRDGQLLALPGIVLKVAEECSGIRSTWVLAITSVVASYVFLDGPWRRFVLVAFVIPLGVLRNGFRILTIGLLCVYVGPHMIDSTIHHYGGPLFFVLSLGPFFLLLWWLRRQRGAVVTSSGLAATGLDGHRPVA
jgi:exosortase C (VPDSG-CTERM-specific)